MGLRHEDVYGLWNPLLAQREFCRAMGIMVNRKPTVPSVAQFDLARLLIAEEYHELSKEFGNILEILEIKQNGVDSHGDEAAASTCDAMAHSYLTDATAEAADLVYVICQFCNMFGLPLEQIYMAIHAANMRKVNPRTGKITRREDGKVLKPDGWKPADLNRIYLSARTDSPVV